MEECIICQLVDGRLPSWIVYQDENVICFLPLEMEVYGHTVIAPKLHLPDLFCAPAERVNDLFAATQKLALHFCTAIQTSGVNLLHASGSAAQQSVPHLHVHLLPRFENDGLNAWPAFPKLRHDKNELLQKLRL